MTNQSPFRLVVKTVESFSLILSGFAAAVTFLFNIVFTVSADYVMSLFTDALVTINSGKIRSTISAVKLSQKETLTFNLKKISVIPTVRETIKATTSLVQYLVISPLGSLKYKVTSAISAGKHTMTLTAILAQFNSLLDFDYTILGDLDTQTLGDMDYTLV